MPFVCVVCDKLIEINEGGLDFDKRPDGTRYDKGFCKDHRPFQTGKPLFEPIVAAEVPDLTTSVTPSASGDYDTALD